MEFKPNWEQTKQHFLAFWEAQNEERALIAVSAPNHLFDATYYHETFGIERFADDDHASIRHWWCDVEENVKRKEYIFQTTHFAGESLPIAFTNWGAMAMCSFFACEPVFNKESVWYHKVIHDWETWQWQFDAGTNEYFKITHDITKAFAENGVDRYFAGMPELGDAGDVLSLIRGMDDLCLDMYDHPETLQFAIDYLTTQFLKCQDILYEVIKPTNDGGGTLPWMNLWMPGKNGNQLACDFSWVISNHDFQRFFTDMIQREAAWSDYATYHVDGPMCMKNHLDWILEFDNIKAIEWTPGEGSPPSTSPDYFSVYQKILKKGKRLVIAAHAEEVDTLTKELPPEGLFIRTWADTQEQAEQLVSIAAQNAKLHK